jgi:hypothetical protein
VLFQIGLSAAEICDAIMRAATRPVTPFLLCDLTHFHRVLQQRISIREWSVWQPAPPPWGHRMSRHPRNLSGKTTAFRGKSACAGELLNGCGRRFILAIIPAPELDFIPAFCRRAAQ